MKKGVIGFIVGLLIVAVVFVCTVLVMSSINNRTFTEEIKSWGQKEEKVIEEDVVEDNVDSGTEENPEVENGTETTAMITLTI